MMTSEYALFWLEPSAQRPGKRLTQEVYAYEDLPQCWRALLDLRLGVQARPVRQERKHGSSPVGWASCRSVS